MPGLRPTLWLRLEHDEDGQDEAEIGEIENSLSPTSPRTTFFPPRLQAVVFQKPPDRLSPHPRHKFAPDSFFGQQAWTVPDPSAATLKSATPSAPVADRCVSTPLLAADPGV
jgi:hypothetical protein